MIADGHETSKVRKSRRNTFLALVVSLVFFGLSILSRRIYSLFGLVVLMGIGFPLAWDGITRKWQSLVFFKRNVWKSLAWGIGAGVISSLIGLCVLRDLAIPSNLGQQLLIGIPLWLLVISPFQEFFFRGLIQSGLTDKLGKWMGLLIANVCFTAWHYLSPIVDLAPFPLKSWIGLISTFIAGLVYGYAFQRSENIIAPWLAHTISGVLFMVFGAMDLIQVIK